ncbi:MAG TPA: hypothetical protein VHY35_08380 [Stellaceae bacterium]|jgi:tetratricopeptide (TPR) repeat protein|nr:hypothetical protein [Stellaceae bacterium]
MTLLRCVVLLLAMFSADAGFAADKPEPAGPPLSAAPRPAAAPASRAPAAPTSEASEAATYDRCLTLAKQDPAAARTLAESWQKRGGQHPAEHCLAVALFGLKQYKEAAEQLDKLGQAMIHAPATLRAEVFGQGAQAWLLAGDAGRAYAAETSALALRPDDAELLVDRAAVAGSAGWFDKVLPDLDQVLKSNPSRVDALIYRATAYRELKKLDPALADINKAVSLAPNSVPALLERGNIHALRGEIDSARQDWTHVAKLAPGTPSETAAKANLAQLDVKNAPAPATPHTASSAKPSGKP